MKSFLGKVFCANILLYVLMLVVFGCGIVLGIIFCDELVEISVVSEEYYLVVFGSESGTTIFLSRVVNNLFLCIIFSATFISPFFIVLSVLALFYRGFVLGTALISVIASLGGVGVLLCVFLIIPIQMLLHFALLSISLFYFKSAKSGLKEFIPSFLGFYVATLSVALLELSVIYFVIRPLTVVL